MIGSEKPGYFKLHGPPALRDYRGHYKVRSNSAPSLGSFRLVVPQRMKDLMNTSHTLDFEATFDWLRDLDPPGAKQLNTVEYHMVSRGTTWLGMWGITRYDAMGLGAMDGRLWYIPAWWADKHPVASGRLMKRIFQDLIVPNFLTLWNYDPKEIASNPRIEPWLKWLGATRDDGRTRMVRGVPTTYWSIDLWDRQQHSASPVWG